MSGGLQARSVALHQGSDLFESWRITVTGTIDDGREVDGVLVLEWNGGERFFYDPDEALLTVHGVSMSVDDSKLVIRAFEGTASETTALEGIQRLAAHHDTERARALVDALDSRLRDATTHGY